MERLILLVIFLGSFSYDLSASEFSMKQVNINISGAAVSLSVPNDEAKDFIPYESLKVVNAFDSEAYDGEYYNQNLTEHYWIFKGYPWQGRFGRIGGMLLSVSLWQLNDDRNDVETLKKWSQTRVEKRVKKVADKLNETLQGEFKFDTRQLSEGAIESVYQKDGPHLGRGLEVEYVFPLFEGHALVLNGRIRADSGYEEKVYSKARRQLEVIRGALNIIPNTTSN